MEEGTFPCSLNIISTQLPIAVGLQTAVSVTALRPATELSHSIRVLGGPFVTSFIHKILDLFFNVCVCAHTRVCNMFWCSHLSPLLSSSLPSPPLHPYQSPSHTDGFFVLCVPLWLWPEPSLWLWLWYWNNPLESHGYISDDKTEDDGSSPPTIHQEPVISNNGQKPMSPPLSVIDCWEGLSCAGLLIGVGMSSEYIRHIMSRGYFTALSLSSGSCILSISSFHKFPELWKLRLA